MIVTVASYKGGVCKTTTAVHLAAFLETQGRTVLFDGDRTLNATQWAESKGTRFPFTVSAPEYMVKMARAGEYEHMVVDTGQQPSDEELCEAARGSDLLVIPAVPGTLDTMSLGQTVRALQAIDGAKFRVLLARVSPDAAGAAQELRELLAEEDVPVFVTEIPRLKAFEKAAFKGVTVDQVKDPNAARAWAAYVAAGKELLA